jgi:hypothetical protein
MNGYWSTKLKKDRVSSVFLVFGIGDRAVLSHSLSNMFLGLDNVDTILLLFRGVYKYYYYYYIGGGREAEIAIITS